MKTERVHTEPKKVSIKITIVSIIRVVGTISKKQRIRIAAIMIAIDVVSIMLIIVLVAIVVVVVMVSIVIIVIVHKRIAIVTV